MSDSDSDAFTALITNSEEAFWSNYCVSRTLDSAKETASTSHKDNIVGTVTKYDVAIASTSQMPSTTRKKTSKRRRILSEDSSDDGLPLTQQQKKKGCDRETVTKQKLQETRELFTFSSNHCDNISSEENASLGGNGDTHKTTDNQTQINTESLLASIMQTLSKPASHDCSGSSTTINRKASQSCRGKRQVKTRKKQPPKPKLSTSVTPQHIDDINQDIINISASDIVLSSVDEGSKTPPYKHPSNRELNKLVDVKVLWKSIYVNIFKIRRFTPLKVIIDHYAAKENVNPKYICFSMNDKMVNLNLHSSVTLRYKPHFELEGGIIEWDDLETRLVVKEDKGVKLLVRSNETAKTVVLGENVILEQLYGQVVIKFGLTFGKFKLEFDGRIINCYDTIRELGLEEDDCIDILV